MSFVRELMVNIEEIGLVHMSVIDSRAHVELVPKCLSGSSLLLLFFDDILVLGNNFIFLIIGLVASQKTHASSLCVGISEQNGIFLLFLHRRL